MGRESTVSQKVVNETADALVPFIYAIDAVSRLKTK